VIDDPTVQAIDAAILDRVQREVEAIVREKPEIAGDYAAMEAAYWQATKSECGPRVVYYDGVLYARETLADAILVGGYAFTRVYRQPGWDYYLVTHVGLQKADQTRLRQARGWRHVDWETVSVDLCWLEVTPDGVVGDPDVLKPSVQRVLARWNRKHRS
jgi:hypothetical protein